jgi:hypothetical protein
MYFYEIGYGSCEDSGVIQLIHDRSFRQYQFNKMVFECAIEAAKSYFQERVKDYTEFNESKESDRYWDERTISINWSEIYEKTAELMCEKYNFVIPKPKCTFWGWGWANLREKGSWKGFCGKNRLQNKISKEIRNIFPNYIESYMLDKEE